MKGQISLQLEHPNKTYTSGDTINGVVNLNLHKRIEVKEIVVSIDGIAKARNGRRVHTNLVNTSNTSHTHYETRKTYLISIPVRVYPTPESQPISPSDLNFALNQGQYYYPFSIAIPYPNSAGVGTLPPSFLYQHGLNNYAKVIYEVSAVVKTPHFYRSNLSSTQEIGFAPLNATLQLNLAHVLDRSGFLLPPVDGKGTRVKFEPLQLATRSSWKRMFQVNTIKIPLELQVEFSQNDPTSSIPTPARVLQINNRLSLSLKLSLLCPFNNDTLQAYLFTDNERKGIPENWPNKATIRLTHISITLRGSITYIGAQSKSHRYTLRVVLDKRLNEILNFSDFLPTQYPKTNTGYNIFHESDPKMMHLLRNGLVYKLPFNSLWFDGIIPNDITSSFQCPNIDNYYDFTVRLTMVSLPGDRFETLKFSSNVVLMRNESPYQPQLLQSPLILHPLPTEPRLQQRPDVPPPPYVA